MRILFCNYEYPPLGGGGGVLNAHLAEELAHRHDVTVLTSRALGTPETETGGCHAAPKLPVSMWRRLGSRRSSDPRRIPVQDRW